MFDLRAGILLSASTCMLCGLAHQRCACSLRDPFRRMGDAARS